MSDLHELELLARYAASLDVAALPADTQTTARACLLYGLAVGIATKRTRPAQLAATASQMEGGGGAAATRLIDGAATSRSNAVFANAVLLSGRVQGDSHPCGHLGGVVIPSALAAAEEAHASGPELLSAMISGYETALRIGRDHAADLSTRGFRTTPCYGVFGAAIAGGRIRRFGEQQMLNAIGLAANFAGGLREYVAAGTEESPFQAGFAARNGLHVTDLIACGLVSAPTALHGKAGFYAAFGMDSGTDYGRRLAEGLGTHFEFTNVTFKQYPACQFLRGIIRGLSNLRAQSLDAVPSLIELHMNPYEADFIGVRFSGPFFTAAQTVMSAPFCAALAWTSGTASFDGLRDFDNVAVNQLVRRIKVFSDVSRARYEPLMRVVCEDGRTLSWEEKDGDAGYRMNWDDAVKMTRQLCDEVGVPATVTNALIERALRVDEMQNVKPLVSAVCAATQSR
jgi:2-methylcitrate dehydratase PrpD